LLLAMLFAVTALTGCNELPEAYDGEGTDIGTGSVTFRFEKTDAEGNLSAWNVSTDEDYVGDALLAVGLIEGEQFDWGLMVTYINGVGADGGWWAFYVDGEFSMLGVSDTEIDSAKVYAFVHRTS